jgi:hypothetical protein
MWMRSASASASASVEPRGGGAARPPMGHTAPLQTAAAHALEARGRARWWAGEDGTWMPRAWAPPIQYKGSKRL